LIGIAFIIISAFMIQYTQEESFLVTLLLYCLLF